MVRKSYIKISHSLEDFLKLEASAGVLLVVATALAIIMSNSGLAGLYSSILDVKASINIGRAGLEKNLLHWINDGLMALFFFLVGLEIKREVVAGELSTRERAVLPALAALGGIAIPALAFWAVNREHPAHLDGWAIPAATDIAFALGVIALLGKRVPASAKVLLMAVAVMDDLGAIIIIALFYTDNLSLQALATALGLVATLFTMNRLGVMRPAAYVLVGFALWVAVLKSGVHATLAGVVTALFIPGASRGGTRNIGAEMEHTLHPWVSYLILPAFAFGNAGVSLEGFTPARIMDPLTLGIIAGLAVGKQVGVFGALALAVKSGLSPMPNGLGMWHLYGLSLLCGIGFTMSLFIGSLAFPDDKVIDSIRIGVLAASIFSAVAGYTVLRLIPPINERTKK